MRVRPFFWLLLTAICAGVLIFSATISATSSLPMHVHIHQVSTTEADSAVVLLHVADAEGVPIDKAHITSHAYMPSMEMGPQQTHIRYLGQGMYLTQIRFSMAGFWKIDITALASGFRKTQESIQLTVF